MCFTDPRSDSPLARLTCTMIKTLLSYADNMRLASAVDGPAIGVSLLCIAHCLLLPLAASTLPLAGPLAEAEWVHKLLVIVSILFMVTAGLSYKTYRHSPVFVLLALIGVSFLCAGAFVEQLKEAEQALTVIGAIGLSLAHLWRWRMHDLLRRDPSSKL